MVSMDGTGLFKLLQKTEPYLGILKEITRKGSTHEWMEEQNPECLMTYYFHDLQMLTILTESIHRIMFFYTQIMQNE
jgi:hypothetical protein